jgi:hypothetical protein
VCERFEPVFVKHSFSLVAATGFRNQSVLLTAFYFSRQCPGLLDADTFRPAAFTRQQPDLATRDVKQAGKKTDQVFIRLAIHGRSAEPDFQAFAIGAIQGVAGGLRLNMDGQNQVFTIPLIPGGRHNLLTKQRYKQHLQDLQADKCEQG